MTPSVSSMSTQPFGRLACLQNTCRPRAVVSSEHHVDERETIRSRGARAGHRRLQLGACFSVLLQG
eukprot:15450487-Alexandrium_andersonii.AAC.1